MHPLSFRILIPFLLLSFVALVSCTRTQEEYYGDGTLKSTITYRGDKMNGPASWYYPNGVKQLECTYVDDSLEGRATRWYSNGQKQREDLYVNNKKNGQSFVYDESGNLAGEEQYLRDTLHGPYREYYTSGQVNIEGRFYMGSFDSIWTYYDKRGLVVGTGEFKRGTGKLSGYYWNGKLKREIQYVNNLKDGNEVWYSEDGRLIKEIRFEAGKVEEVVIGDTSNINNTMNQ